MSNFLGMTSGQEAFHQTHLRPNTSYLKAGLDAEYYEFSGMNKSTTIYQPGGSSRVGKRDKYSASGSNLRFKSYTVGQDMLTVDRNRKKYVAHIQKSFGSKAMPDMFASHDTITYGTLYNDKRVKYISPKISGPSVPYDTKNIQTKIKITENVLQGEGYSPKDFKNVWLAKSRLYKENLVDAKGQLVPEYVDRYFRGEKEETETFYKIAAEAKNLKRKGHAGAVLKYEIDEKSGDLEFYYMTRDKDTGEFTKGKAFKIEAGKFDKDSILKMMLGAEAGLVGGVGAIQQTKPYYKILGSGVVNGAKLDAVMRHMFLNNSLSVSAQSMLMFNRTYVV